MINVTFSVWGHAIRSYIVCKSVWWNHFQSTPSTDPLIRLLFSSVLLQDNLNNPNSSIPYFLAMSSSQCFQNPPNLNSGIHGAGTIQELAGLSSYVTGSPDSKLALILISDIFGKKPISNVLSFNLFYNNLILILFPTVQQYVADSILDLGYLQTIIGHL